MYQYVDDKTFAEIVNQVSNIYNNAKASIAREPDEKKRKEEDRQSFINTLNFVLNGYQLQGSERTRVWKKLCSQFQGRSVSKRRVAKPATQHSLPFAGASK